MDTEKLPDHSKVESYSGKVEGSKLVPVIIKVITSGYVPEGVFVRKRIDPFLFTADILQDTIYKLETDSKVKSVSINRAMNMIK